MSGDQPNILFVVLDTVRAQNLSAYGYERDTSPFLSRFADDSVLYQHAYAPAPWTTPSHAAMFTGSYATEHQTDRNMERLTPDFPTLAELLGQAGYETVGFSNNIHISPNFDFDRGFDEFTFNGQSYNEPLDGGLPISELRSHTGSGSFPTEARNALQYISEQDKSVAKTLFNWIYRKGSENGFINNHDRGAKTTNTFVNDYLQRNRDTPFFMFLNYMEAHAPYQSPSKYQHRYVTDPEVSGWENKQSEYFNREVTDQDRKLAAMEDQYDGCIRYVDTQIERLIDILKQNHVFDDTLVIIGSDHGEGFGEHGLYEHKIGVFNELSHVPLLINPPDTETGVVETPVSMRWVYPTLLSMAGVDVPGHVEERSLLNPTNHPVIIESEGLPYSDLDYTAVDERFAAPQQGFVDPDTHLKLISFDHDESTALYEIDDESTNVIDSHQSREEQLSEALTEILDRHAGAKRSDAEDTFEINDDTRKHLQELGYH